MLESNDLYTVTIIEKKDNQILSDSVIEITPYSIIPLSELLLDKQMKETLVKHINNINNSKSVRNSSLDIEYLNSEYSKFSTVDLIVLSQLKKGIYSISEERGEYSNILIKSIFIINNHIANYIKVIFVFTTPELIALKNGILVELKGLNIIKDEYDDYEIYIEDNPPSKIIL